MTSAPDSREVIAKKTIIKVKVRRLLADMVTPVTLYLKFREHFENAVLLESNDIHSKEEVFSFLGLEPIADFQVSKGTVTCSYPDGNKTSMAVEDTAFVPEALHQFLQSFQLDYEQPYDGVNGLFGHTCFDGVQYFDTLRFDAEKRKMDIPDIRYSAYRFVIAINHFKDELHLLENIPDGSASRSDEVEAIIREGQIQTGSFKMVGEEQSNLTDDEFKELVTLGKYHCQRGDVFQIVFSRQFRQAFDGDDFQVYRVLRSINPSPYLFYFDYEDYRIFGSSPESQMVIRNGIARVNPIAGTYRRTGDVIEDAKSAAELAADPKENAEHIMLVDLARNDLGRHATNVKVQDLKEIQFFSHVIHLVSTVEGDLPENTNPLQIYGDTFPAGTLSGAPKYKAIELINRYENQNRSFYGGALGYIGFDGEILHAIVIRSFLSKDNGLFYQAGAGIVVASQEEKELQEVNNKLGALKKALKEAEKI